MKEHINPLNFSKSFWKVMLLPGPRIFLFEGWSTNTIDLILSYTVIKKKFKNIDFKYI